MSVTLFEYKDDEGFVFKLKSKLVFIPIAIYQEGADFDIDDKFYYEYKEGDEYLNENYDEYISLKVRKINEWVLQKGGTLLNKKEKKLEDIIKIYKKAKFGKQWVDGTMLKKNHVDSICEDILLKYKKYVMKAGNNQ